MAVLWVMPPGTRHSARYDAMQFFQNLERPRQMDNKSKNLANWRGMDSPSRRIATKVKRLA